MSGQQRGKVHVDGEQHRMSRAVNGASVVALASAREELTFLAHLYLSVRQNEARIAPGSTPDLALDRKSVV